MIGGQAVSNQRLLRFAAADGSWPCAPYVHKDDSGVAGHMGMSRRSSAEAVADLSPCLLQAPPPARSAALDSTRAQTVCSGVLVRGMGVVDT